VNIWNKWKKDNVEINLSGANLREANLWGVNLINANLWGADLSEADLRKANLSNANLNGAYVNRTNLNGANLSNADLSANFMEAHLIRADLSGAYLIRADLSHAYLFSANLSNADLSYADLRKANLSGANLIEANLNGANLSGTNLYATKTEGWKIDGIKCDYFYNDPDGKIRIPKDRNFEKGELKKKCNQLIFDKIIKDDFSQEINRSIEFPPEYYQTGISILNYFGTVLKKKDPNSNATINIKQDGLKVTMIIDPMDGDKEVIEKTLDEYGLVITGEKPIEEFTDDKLFIIELRSELRMAQERIERQRDLLQYKDNEVKSLKDDVKDLKEDLKETNKDLKEMNRELLNTIKLGVQKETNVHVHAGDKVDINGKNVAFGKNNADVKLTNKKD